MSAAAGPFDAWLALRGVRIGRHCDNAERVVELLAAHPRGRGRAPPGPAGPLGPRRRREADEPVRRHGVVPTRRWRLKDKYGLSWQIAPHALMDLIHDSGETKSARVMAAMLTMSKIDLAELRAAYGGK